MITIREKIEGKKKYFERVVSNGKLETIQTIEYRMVAVKKDEKDYFVLYDDEMQSISPFFQFVNYGMAHLAYNSREQASHAIRLLYCYAALTKTDICNMKNGNISNFL